MNKYHVVEDEDYWNDPFIIEAYDAGSAVIATAKALDKNEGGVPTDDREFFVREAGGTEIVKFEVCVEY